MNKLPDWLRAWVIRLGIAGLVGFSITMIITFFIAFLNGNEVTVAINDYGEANIEFVMIIILIPCMIYTLSCILEVK